MKATLLPTALLVIAACGTIAAAGAPQDPPIGQDPNVAAELAAMRAAVDQMATDNMVLIERVEQLEAFATKRSKDAEKMMKVFAKAEELGYTAGINFESRQALLEGFRTYMSDAKFAADAGASEDEDKAGAREARRSRRR